MKETPLHRFLYKIDFDSIPPICLVIITLLWFGYYMSFMNFKYETVKDYPCIELEQKYKYNDIYIAKYGTKLKEGPWEIKGTLNVKIPKNCSTDKTKYYVRCYETRSSSVSLFGFGHSNELFKTNSCKLIKSK